RPPQDLRGQGEDDAVPANGNRGGSQDRFGRWLENGCRDHLPEVRSGGDVRTDEREQGPALGAGQRRPGGDCEDREGGVRPLLGEEVRRAPVLRTHSYFAAGGKMNSIAEPTSTSAFLAFIQSLPRTPSTGLRPFASN